jgi:hypothetical protein
MTVQARILLPTLEPAIEAIIAALGTELGDQLDAVTNEMAARGLAPVPLLAPAVVRRALLHAGELPTEWPTLIVLAAEIHRESAGQRGQYDESPRAGLWRGTVGLACWLQNDDPDTLARQVYRYQAALWRVVTAHDIFDTAVIAPETFTTVPTVPQGASEDCQPAVVTVDLLLRA